MDRILVVGGCTDACEEGCLRSAEISAGLDGFQLAPIELRVPRRSPAMFRDDSGQSALVVGGCAGPGRHLSSAEVVALDGARESGPADSVGYEFSCAAFCQLQVAAYISHVHLAKDSVLDWRMLPRRRLRRPGMPP